MAKFLLKFNIFEQNRKADKASIIWQDFLIICNLISFL